MTVITIHRGEILQIERIISQRECEKTGDLYGLFTESFQPVVLIIFGGQNRDECGVELYRGHGLKKLGEWTIENGKEQEDKKLKEVSLLFDDEGFAYATYGGEDAEVDIIEDQSAFRLFQPVTAMLTSRTGLDNSIIEITKEPAKEIQVKSTQWYSTEKGVNILREIYTQLPHFGFIISTMSRDKTTEDITILVKESCQTHMQIEIYFPYDFPISNPDIIMSNDRKKKLGMKNVNPETQPGEVVALLCSSLLEFVSSENSTSDNGVMNNHSNPTNVIKEKESDVSESSKKQESGKVSENTPSLGSAGPANNDLHQSNIDTEVVNQEESHDTRLAGQGNNERKESAFPHHDSKYPSSSSVNDPLHKNEDQNVKEHSMTEIQKIEDRASHYSDTSGTVISDQGATFTDQSSDAKTNKGETTGDLSHLNAENQMIMSPNESTEAQKNEDGSNMKVDESTPPIVQGNIIATGALSQDQNVTNQETLPINESTEAQQNEDVSNMEVDEGTAATVNEGSDDTHF